MFVFDLRWLLFGFLVLLIATVVLTVWLLRRWDERQQHKTPPSADLIHLDIIAAQQAEQAMRFLINDLSHELRTPLATLLTHLEVLKLPNISPETRQQSIHLMQSEGRRMSRLLYDLLELGRLQTTAVLELRPIPLRALVADALGEMALSAAERQITLSLEADADLPWVAGDADRLKQVFLNLLDNAVKYSRPGDRVVVSLQCDAERTHIMCAVCDTGPGIPAEHLPHITRRFYRATNEVEGSGLGLALVEEVLRRHHSRLEIESYTEGDETGTCVRFALPVIFNREP